MRRRNGSPCRSMAALMRGTSAISTPDPTIKMPPNLKRQALANCDYTYTRMATTKGSKAKGNKRKRRGSLQPGASRWKEGVQAGLRLLHVQVMGELPWLVCGRCRPVVGSSD